ncbi:hypothetical protein INT46_009103 [Mucor plumbeus]|uniref:Derlin n=1 Tax=Mucor plumbeus TaxID=97098 RepID=A0A8H7UT45_9FUNG|nr:hypothetical protein INT46_009103 [Mucor plumbeus]
MIRARYSRMMEEGFFRNKPADYVWLMVFSASVLLVISIIVPFASLPFMGSALSFTMVYIWARRNPFVRLNFLGLLVFTAPYLPWVLLIFSLCLGGQIPTGDILGVLVGHIYYFFEDVWPRDPMSQGKKWLATPRIIRWLVEGNRPRDDSIEIATEQVEEEEEEEQLVEAVAEQIVEAEVEQHSIASESTINNISTAESIMTDGDLNEEKSKRDEISGYKKEQQAQTITENNTLSTATSTSSSSIALSPNQSTSSNINETSSA